MPEDMSTPRGPQDPRIPRSDPPAESQSPMPPTPPYVYGYPQPQSPSPQSQSQQAQYPQAQPQPTIAFQRPQPQPQYPAQPFIPPVPEPDWAAMAGRREAQAKRKRVLIIVGAVVAVAVLGGAAFLGATGLGHSSDDKTVVTASGTASPQPSTARPSPTSSPTRARTLRASSVLSSTSLKVNGQTYTRMATDTLTPCWKGTVDGLGGILSTNHCSQMLRATYVSSSITVTVGIAVFPTGADARAAETSYKGAVEPLYGKGINGSFCTVAEPCAQTQALHGRYLYMTIAGPTVGVAPKNSHPTDAWTTAGHGVAGYGLSAVIKLNQSDD